MEYESDLDFSLCAFARGGEVSDSMVRMPWTKRDDDNRTWMMETNR